MLLEKGYKEAKQATCITKQYGNRYKLADAFLAKAEAFPDIKSEDEEALNQFSLFLQECQNTLEDLDYLDELIHPRTIKMLVAKFLYKLCERWRSLTDNIQEEKGLVVRFHDLVKFVSKRARIVRNPVYGNIKDKMDSKQAPVSRPRKTARSYVANTSTPVVKQCIFCDSTTHNTEVCKKLGAKPNPERIKFLQSKGVCFGCLKKASHIAKDCTNSHFCGNLSFFSTQRLLQNTKKHMALGLPNQHHLY